MNLRILARVVVYDPAESRILLVRNKGMKFWYAPGGGWEYDTENILLCAKREVKEEAGIEVDIKKLLYVQEFHESSGTIFFEIFWLGIPSGEANLNKDHIDLDPNGQVEEAKWFSKDELKDLKVFPDRLKDSFWEEAKKSFAGEDPFLGVC